ncbi:MAG: methionyl-tRNA formyltransferase, partial [Gammaproteobacteria bacterium]|nr:methionyl-tRNA formyltransferase [Gammaproteobacteria bacterium]
VASTTWQGKTIRLWNVAQVEQASGGLTPGTIVRADASGVHIATGDGLLNITHLQAEGGKVLTAADFLNGHRMAAGDRLGDATQTSSRS